MHTIQLIYTHDLHSAFEQWPKVVGVLRRLQGQFVHERESYALIDLGDHMDRSHFVTEATLGEANIDFMNRVGYDYVTIGNNEGITFTKPRLHELYARLNAQVLVNNLFDEGQRPAWALPYEVRRFGPIRVAFIGTTVAFTAFYDLLGWDIRDPFDHVQRNIDCIKSANEADIIVLLSHLGLPRDSQLAEQIQGIDVILGAHTHHVLADGLRINNTVIHQVGKLGRHVGQTTIKVDGDEAVHISCRMHDVEHEQPDHETVHRLDKWSTVALQKMNQPVIFLANPLHLDWFAESFLPNLLAESLRRRCGTQVALVNNGQILDMLPAGIVTKLDIHQICPHPINPCTIKITGHEMMAVLKRSLYAEQQRMEIKGFGFRGKVLGMLAIDGIQVKYRKNGHDTYELEEVSIGGQALVPDREYDVATIDMFTFGSFFPELYQKKNTTYIVPDFLRDLLADRLRKGHLASATRERWLPIHSSRGDIK